MRSLQRRRQRLLFCRGLLATAGLSVAVLLVVMELDAGVVILSPVWRWCMAALFYCTFLGSGWTIPAAA